MVENTATPTSGGGASSEPKLDKIYAILCDQSLSSMGFGYVRTAVEGIEESTISLDWSNVRAVPVISLEDAAFEAGETRIVKIKPITVAPKSAVLRSFYVSNGMGNLVCIGSTYFQHFDEERLADKAMFHSRIKGNMFKGDLIGHIFIVPSAQT